VGKWVHPRTAGVETAGAVQRQPVGKHKVAGNPETNPVASEEKQWQVALAECGVWKDCAQHECKEGPDASLVAWARDSNEELQTHIKLLLTAD